MTALSRYQRLEAEGRWRIGAGATPRDVIVKFGDASLIVLAPDDTPLAHWPLASLREVEDDAPGVALSPDIDSEERLWVADADMIEAIRAVSAELNAPPPRRRRRANVWVAAGLVAVAGAIWAAGWFALPVVAERAIRGAPPGAAAALGAAATPAFVEAVLAAPPPRMCAAGAGARAMTRLLARLGADDSARVLVYDHPRADAWPAPDGTILVARGLIDHAPSPEALAAALAHDLAHVAARDALAAAAAASGPRGAARGLSGALGPADGRALAASLSENGYGAEAEAAADEAAFAMLAAAGLPSGAYAAMTAPGGDGPAHHRGRDGAAQAAVAADVVGEAAFTPALSDQDWLALRAICD